MALKIVFLVLLAHCISEAQSQGSLPLTYNATEIQGGGAICPNDQLRQETRQNITNSIRNLLQSTVVPLLEPPTSNATQCPCISQGGTRIAYLNMNDPNQQCPNPWVLITSPRRLCGRHLNGCNSVTFPVNGITYSRVCGQIRAYQYCHTDAFYPFLSNPSRTIDDVYVDGISVTHGSNPRKHIWTFASAYTEISTTVNAQVLCPCSVTNHPNIGNIRIPSYVGNDYFCESGTNSGTNTCSSSQFYINDPLWDGAGCSSTSTCCELNNPPWFCKTLPQPTTDDIEVRLCAESSYSQEDVPVELIEIYVS